MEGALPRRTPSKRQQAGAASENPLHQAAETSPYDWIDPDRSLRLVRLIARRMYRRHPCFPLDSLISAGIGGLMAAAEQYRPGRASFHTYAAIKIRGAILDEARSSARRAERTVALDPRQAARDDIEAGLDRDRRARELREAIERLPEAERLVMELELAGCSSQESARMLRIDIRTQYDRRWKAMKRLRLDPTLQRLRK